MAQSKSVGSLYIDIEARMAKLETDLGKVNNLLSNLATKVGSFGSKLSTAFSFLSGQALWAGIQKVGGLLDSMSMAALSNVMTLQRMAEATGFTISQVQIFDRAMSHLGETNINLAMTMKNLDVFTSKVRNGAKGTSGEMAKLNLNTQQFGEAMPFDRLKMFLAALGQMTDTSARANIAQQVLGRQVVNISQVVHTAGSAFDNASKELDAMNGSLSRVDVAKVQVAFSSLKDLSDRWEVFKTRIAIGLTPAIFAISERLSNILANIDFDKLLSFLANGIANIFAFITTFPERMKSIILQIRIAWGELMSDMSGTPLAKMFGGIDAPTQKIAAMKAELASLSAEIEKSTGLSVGDFEKRVDAILANIGEISIALPKVSSEASTIMINTFVSAFSQISDALANMLDDGKFKFADFAKMVVKAMISMMIKLSIINPLMNSIFGTSTGWTTLPTAMPASAVGGPMTPGPRLIGENGPEIVNFGSSGTIIPNDKLGTVSGGGGGGVTINVNQSFANGVTHAEFARAIPSIVQQTKSAVVDAVMRGGGYRKAMNT